MSNAIPTDLPDYMQDAALFEVEQPPPVSLADKFLVGPFSVLDRRQGEWQDRKRKWLSLGIASEVGRDVALLGGGFGAGCIGAEHANTNQGTSIFDPVLCELAYRWFSAPGDRILDPFAGGSVRGIVASILARWYVGIDLRAEQIAANESQAHLGSDIAPQWIEGDARDAEALTGEAEFDMAFTCPPYADLEVYSDDARDLSTLDYAAFIGGYRDAIAAATRLLKQDRFFGIVISDVRDKRTGNYRGLVADTVLAGEAAGLSLYNDAIVLDPVGSARLRAARSFRNRKLTRLHQHLLIFVKGNGNRAARRLTAIEGAA